MATKLDELLETLDEIIQLLESDGERHWSRWMRQSRERLQNSDFLEIEHLLSAYGGMGSFNDLVICQSYENGDRLNELRDKAWELADAMRREFTNK
jgi:hypothetical protein